MGIKIHKKQKRNITSVTRNKYNVITHVAIHCTRSPSGLLIVAIIAKHQEVLFKDMKGERAR